MASALLRSVTRSVTGSVTLTVVQSLTQSFPQYVACSIARFAGWSVICSISFAVNESVNLCSLPVKLFVDWNYIRTEVYSVTPSFVASNGQSIVHQVSGVTSHSVLVQLVACLVVRIVLMSHPVCPSIFRSVSYSVIVLPSFCLSFRRILAESSASL